MEEGAVESVILLAIALHAVGVALMGLPPEVPVLLALLITPVIPMLPEAAQAAAQEVRGLLLAGMADAAARR
jgi:hypothetical protein